MHISNWTFNFSCFAARKKNVKNTGIRVHANANIHSIFHNVFHASRFISIWRSIVNVCKLPTKLFKKLFPNRGRENREQKAYKIRHSICKYLKSSSPNMYEWSMYPIQCIRLHTEIIWLGGKRCDTFVYVYECVYYHGFSIFALRIWGGNGCWEKKERKLLMYKTMWFDSTPFRRYVLEQSTFRFQNSHFLIYSN